LMAFYIEPRVLFYTGIQWNLVLTIYNWYYQIDGLDNLKP
jgi:hypothetical protein